MIRRIIATGLIWMLFVSIAGLNTEVAEARSSKVYHAKVYADSLNVRSEASSNGSVKGSVKNGQIVSVTDEAHGWLKIQADGISGWVAGYYLKKVTGSEANVKTVSNTTSTNTGKTSTVQTASVGKSTNKLAVVSVDALRMREGPSVDHAVRGVLYKGAEVSVTETKDGWHHVKTSKGSKGWVSGTYIQFGGSVGNSSSSGDLKGKVIVIDPGHGGNDPGKVGTAYETLEKKINLSTANYLADYLRARGAVVRMTRTDDTKPSLASRVAISHEAAADAFVSIHYNSSPKKTSGTLTYFYSPKKDERLARSIETRLGGGIGLKSNGIAYGDFHVLRENNRPAVLLELGFLSNPKDEGIVRNADYQKKAAAAIASGLADYFKNRAS
ncbi:cell wall hydrolase [Paenibacillaceae bacterium]|nr:cell wall hydrolase [Paenibacillaceae bacterium]